MISAAPIQLARLPGSLRKASFSRSMLASLRDRLASETSLEILSPDLPLYNEDEDGERAPDGVRFEMRSRAMPA